MEIDFGEIEPRVAYRWMGSTITPRPVAWVSSLSSKGVANLAPFSFFQMITANPPTLMFSPLMQSNGLPKDTVANIRDTGEFVVNLVSFDQVDQMNETSFTFAPEVSEFERCAIGSAPSVKVKPRRVLGAPVVFECKLSHLMPYPASNPSCHVVFGEVIHGYFDERILDDRGAIDPNRLNLVSRMGANWYGRTASEANFELERPLGWDRLPNQ